MDLAWYSPGTGLYDPQLLPLPLGVDGTGRRHEIGIGGLPLLGLPVAETILVTLN
jgi:hypothetical protein